MGKGPFRWTIAYMLHTNNFRWHADLKPDNILRVHGEFKLADFGFAKFKKRAPDRKPMEYIEGGTETYGKCPLPKSIFA
jgi:serine/threonine protein kinase